MDAEQIQKGLEMLVYNHTALAKERQQMDLTQLIESFKRVELDLSTILSGCVFLGRQYWKDHNLQLMESLHRSCDVMRSLLQDLDKIRTAMNKERINDSAFRQLIMDWGRLKESIYRTQECMEYSQRRRKNSAWSRTNSLRAQDYGDHAFRGVGESSGTGS